MAMWVRGERGVSRIAMRVRRARIARMARKAMIVTRVRRWFSNNNKNQPTHLVAGVCCLARCLVPRAWCLMRGGRRCPGRGRGGEDDEESEEG